MSTRSEFEREEIARALDDVQLSAKIRGWYEQFEEGHRHKTPEVDEMSAEGLEDSIRSALRYGFPIEAVAIAASMDVDQIRNIADDEAA